MATIKEDISLKFQTTKDGDIEETSFSSGDEVDVVSTWDAYYLIKDKDGHFYNIPKDKLNA
jgi:hypothetical protein